MSKSVIISIKPKWCGLIAGGKKAVEVRKTRPKIEAPFRVYIYCTKDKRNHCWIGKRYSYADECSHNAFDNDGARYRMLGNSLAIPCALRVIGGIADYERRN